MVRDDVRAMWAASGLTLGKLSADDLRSLVDTLDSEMKASGLIDKTFRCNKRMIKRGWPEWLQITCRSFYFSCREAVTFNHDGFVGFGGWADDVNIQPILSGFIKWLEARRA